MSAVEDGPVDLEQMSAVLQAAVAALVPLPWKKLLETYVRADTLGPLLEPTMYRDALYSGRLERNRRVAAAVVAFLDEVLDATASDR